MIESTNLMVNTNELLQLKHSDIRPQAQLATTQALYAALDKCKDLVHITDETYRVQVRQFHEMAKIDRNTLYLLF